MRYRIMLTVIAALVCGSIAAIAGNTTFFTGIGDLVFPFSPPLANGTPGAIDNMIIGANTPVAGHFTTISSTTGLSGPIAATTLSASGAVTGAGFTSRFSAPGPIGDVTPSTGAFTSVGVTDITGTDASLDIAGQAAAQGGAVPIKGGTSSTAGNNGGAASLTGGTPGATANGGIASIVGGIGGTTSGNGGQAKATGGSGTAGNGNGGAVILAGGAANGTGVNGMIIKRSVELVNQGAPAAKTVSATLTTAEVLTGIVTVNQGGAGASALQLPLATDMDTAIPDSAAGDAFDLSLINISAVAAESASITTNTGWTLVGDMDVSANSAATTKSAGRFRARKTGTGAWVLYRLS